MAHEVLAPWAEPVPGHDQMTAEELARLPDDGWLYELVKGRLVRMTPAGGGHGATHVDLTAALHRFVREHHLGRVLGAETGFRLNQPDQPDTVLAPDAAFVRTERLPPRDSPAWDGYWSLAPDLVVEVASPDQHRPELAAKARAWLAAGVRLVWVVWPKSRQVEVWLPGGDDAAAVLSEAATLDGRDVVPCFTYPVAELFA